MAVKDSLSDKFTYYDNNIKALSYIVDVENTYTLYCNTTDKKIIQNDYFVYIDNKILNNSEDIVRYNTNSKSSPEYEYLEFKTMLKLELDKGVVFVKKYLEHIREIKSL